MNIVKNDISIMPSSCLKLTRVSQVKEKKNKEYSLIFTGSSKTTATVSFLFIDKVSMIRKMSLKSI